MSTKIHFTPTFVQTKNVRAFEAMMEGLMLGKGGSMEGDERLGCVSGRAGRGKTRTVQAWAARTGSPYIETVSVWSELDFLQKIGQELGLRQIPGRRGKCFELIIEAMLRVGKPLFLDEIERFGPRYLEIVRDLAKITGGVIVLVGEEQLPHLMQRNRRVWSRTYQALEFEPIEATDILLYVRKCTGLNLGSEALKIMHHASGGDLRIVKRDTINLAHAAASLQRGGEVDAELAKIACKSGLRGGF